MPEATTSSCFVVLPAGLILLDKGENALFEIVAELGHSFPGLRRSGNVLGSTGPPSRVPG
jgi:FlaA1/EpsC-like NDP-sugar epimerase